MRAGRPLGLSRTAGTPRGATAPSAIRPSVGRPSWPTAESTPMPRPTAPLVLGSGYLEASGHHPRIRSLLRRPQQWGRLSEDGRAGQSPVRKTPREEHGEVRRWGGGSEAHVAPPGGKEAQPPAASPHQVSPSEQRAPQSRPW